MLTLIEYFLLLYRALLPTPVWYRFFLNKEYGSLFSSLTTGLYLTFKLTSVVEKVWWHSTALYDINFWVYVCFVFDVGRVKQALKISAPTGFTFLKDVVWTFDIFKFDSRFNPLLLHWRHYHGKKYFMAPMQQWNRSQFFPTINKPCYWIVGLRN